MQRFIGDVKQRWGVNKIGKFHPISVDISPPPDKRSIYQ